MKILSHIRNLINRLISLVYIPFKNFIPLETFTYAVTGGANTALDIFLYFICYHFVLNKQIVDFGFVAISPHIAAFLIVFPITFIRLFTGQVYHIYQFAHKRKNSTFTIYADCSWSHSFKLYPPESIG